MKNLIIPIILLSTLLTGCDKSENIPIAKSQMALSAGIDAATTKTAIQMGNKVIWNAEDKLSLFSDENNTNTPFSLTEGAGSSLAIFHGNVVSGKKLFAYYPYSPQTTFDGINISTILANCFPYTPGTFSIGQAPMISVSNPDSKLLFTNLCGILKINLIGSSTITKIVLQSMPGSNGIAPPIAGKANITTQEPISLQLDNSATDKTIEITFKEGAKLADKDPTSFFFVLPPGSYGKLRVTIHNGIDSIAREIHNLQVTASTIENMNLFNYDEVLSKSTTLYSVDDGKTWTRTLSQSFTALKVKTTKDGKFTPEEFVILEDLTRHFENEYQLDFSEAIFENTRFPSSFGGYTINGKVTKITSIKFPKNITEIGSHAFNGCTLLKSADIPEGVTLIDDFAFNHCPELPGTLVLPESLITLGVRAFHNCPKLTGKLIIPKNVQEIKELCFGETPNFTQVISQAAIPPKTATNSFAVTQSVPLFVPKGTKDIYKAAEGWKEFLEILEEGEQPSDRNTLYSLDNGKIWVKELPSLFTSLKVKTNEFGKLTYPEIQAIQELTTKFTNTYQLDFSEAQLEGEVFYTYFGESKLTDIKLPNNITELSGTNFNGCLSLKSVKFPKTIRVIGDYSFNHCPELSGTFVLPNGLVTLGVRAFHNCPKLTGDLIIPETVQEIKELCFGQTPNFSQVISLAKTPPKAMANSFAVPDTVPLIVPKGSRDAYKTAEGWKEFKSIYEDGETLNLLYSVDNGQTWNIKMPTQFSNLKIKTLNNVKFSYDLFYRLEELTHKFSHEYHLDFSESEFESNIFPGSFGGYVLAENEQHLSSIKFPKNITEISDFAFYACRHLKSAELISGIQIIGNCAFSGCNALKGKLILPSTLTVLGKHAFDWCSGFNKELIIPANVKEIQDSCFFSTNGFTKIIVTSATPAKVGTNCFPNTESIPLIVPKGALETYKAAAGWKEFKIILQEGEEYSITYSANNGQTWSTNIPDTFTALKIKTTGAAVLPKKMLDKINSISKNNSTPFSVDMQDATYESNEFPAIFGGNMANTYLQTIILPKNITTIKANAFYGCSGLKSTLTIPDKITDIQEMAFYGCSNITGLYLPSSITTIGQSAFQLCDKITELTIPQSVTSIGNMAFLINGITKVIVNSSIPVAISSNTIGNTSHAVLYVPKGTVDAYKNSTGWKNFRYILNIGDKLNDGSLPNISDGGNQNFD